MLIKICILINCKKIINIYSSHPQNRVKHTDQPVKNERGLIGPSQ